MGEWKEYTGSDEQVIELLNTTIDKQFIVDSAWSVFKTPGYLDMQPTSDNIKWLRNLITKSGVTKYFICEPHPYRYELMQWAETGQPVYFKDRDTGYPGECWSGNPPFVFPIQYDYSFKPFRSE